MKAIPWDGARLTKAGLYSGVPIETYHGDLCDGPSLSKSGAWTIFDESAAHYFEGSYLNPAREPRVESDAFILGRGAHHLLLGEAGFGELFAIRPEQIHDPKAGLVDWNGNRTACREWLAMAADQGLTVLKPDHVKAIRGMSRSLAAHPMVAAGILNGLVEHTLVWRDIETGVWIKCRPDVVPTDDLDFADLKSAASVSDGAIERAVGDFGYAVQGAMVAMACEQIFGRKMSSFSLVFAEKAPPYCVRVKTLTDEDLDLGRECARAAIRAFARCIETGVWPGPGGVETDAQFVSMTPWRRKEIEYRLALMNAERERAA